MVFVSLLFASFLILDQEVLQKNNHEKFYYDCSESECNIVSFCYRECAYLINAHFYGEEKSFYIWNTANSKDCSIIEKAIVESYEDPPLQNFFKVKNAQCKDIKKINNNIKFAPWHYKNSNMDVLLKENS